MEKESKKTCKKCKEGNKIALTTLIVGLSGGFLLIYGAVSLVKDIIELFTH